MRKSLLVIALCTFSSLVFAAKTYNLTLVGPTKVGTVQLAKGSYTMYLDGDKAVFKDAHSKTVEVPVKLDNGAAKKFGYTSVESSQKDGTDAIKSIHLGGSTTTVEFGD
jgi:hypothetical protein